MPWGLCSWKALFNKCLTGWLCEFSASPYSSRSPGGKKFGSILGIDSISLPMALTAEPQLEKVHTGQVNLEFIYIADLK